MVNIKAACLIGLSLARHVLGGETVGPGPAADGDTDTTTRLTNLYDSIDARSPLPDPDAKLDENFDQEWDNKYGDQEIYDDGTGRPSETLRELLQPVYKGIECGACLTMCNETSKLISSLVERKTRKTKEVFGAKYTSDFDSTMVVKLEELCERGAFDEKYKISVNGHFSLMLLNTAMETYATQPHKGNEYVQNWDNQAKEKSIDVLNRLRRGADWLFTDDVSEMHDPELDGTIDDGGWQRYNDRVKHFRDVLHNVCLSVKDSNELEEAFEIYVDELPKASYKRICTELGHCEKKMKKKMHLKSNEELKKTALPQQQKRDIKKYMAEQKAAEKEGRLNAEILARNEKRQKQVDETAARLTRRNIASTSLTPAEKKKKEKLAQKQRELAAFNDDVEDDEFDHDEL